MLPARKGDTHSFIGFAIMSTTTLAREDSLASASETLAIDSASLGWEHWPCAEFASRRVHALRNAVRDRLEDTLRRLPTGRPSAVGSMTAKFVSFVMVTLGLFLCTLDDGSHGAANSAQPAVSSTAPVPLPGSVPGFDTPGLTGADAAFSDVVDPGRGGGTNY